METQNPASARLLRAPNVRVLSFSPPCSWSFDLAPPTAKRFIIRHVRAEDADAASLVFSRKELAPRLFSKEPVLLDFGGIATCTQSYVHALLYEALRLGWALKVPIHIGNAQPAVRSVLELLANYALGG